MLLGADVQMKLNCNTIQDLASSYSNHDAGHAGTDPTREERWQRQIAINEVLIWDSLNLSTLASRNAHARVEP